jgi:hypothetical protein
MDALAGAGRPFASAGVECSMVNSPPDYRSAGAGRITVAVDRRSHYEDERGRRAAAHP